MGKGNRYRKFLISIMATIFMVLVMESSCFSSTGVLLMVKGNVTIKSHGATSPAKTGLRLKPGDIVESLGGKASILLADGKMHQLTEGSSFAVPEEKAEGSQDVLVARLMDTIRETAHRGRGPTIKGMVRGEKEIMLIYPFNSVITRGGLRFEWDNVESLGVMELFLKSPSPVYKYSFKAEPGKNKALLPMDSPPLQPGVRYYWKVKGFEEAEMEPFTSKLCWFAILGPEETDKLEKDIKKIDGMGNLDENSKKLLKANLLISYGLYHRAVGILRQARRQFPEDEGMKELLIGLLIKMKNFEEAEKLM